VSKDGCVVNKAGENAVNLCHVNQSAEALPICVAPFMMTVHYTSVQEEVIAAKTDLYDIDSVQSAEPFKA
jgi:hypothetical protein